MKRIWINHDPQKVDLSYLMDHFSEKCEVVAQAAPNDPKIYVPLAQQADIIIGGMEVWNAETLAAVRGKVKMIQKFGMGVDNIDLKAAADNGILVANILGANSAAVAEIALLHILNLGRKFVTCVNTVKAGTWTLAPQGYELDGKTIGLLGFGNIARHLARMLSGFQVKILAYDVTLPDPAGFANVEFVGSREELFRRSDIVSLHIPCTPETRGSINKAVFDSMKPGSCLVNTCRGAVINEGDLVEALRNGKLSAAGLDVLCQEPPEKGNPLLAMDNVFITSHMGAESKEAIYRSQVIMSEAIDTFLAGGIPKFARNAPLLKNPEK